MQTNTEGWTQAAQQISETQEHTSRIRGRRRKTSKSADTHLSAKGHIRHVTGYDDVSRGVWSAAPKRTGDVIAYRAMKPDGMAYLGEDEWSITMSMSDINYVASAQDTKEALVDQWAKFINSFGAGTRIQENVINRVLDEADVTDLVQKPLTGDRFDAWREDFNRIATNKLRSGSGKSVVTEKYLTVTVRESDAEKASAALSRAYGEIQGMLSAMDGCRVERLDRTQRLALLSHLMRPGEVPSFTEDDFAAARKSMHTKDYIAPWAIRLDADGKGCELMNGSGSSHHTVLWVRDYPRWLSDSLIGDLTAIKSDLNISLHIEPFDQADGMGMLNRQIAEFEMQVMTEQKKARRAHYDETMIPHRLTEGLDEATQLREELEQSNQKILSTVLIIGITGTTKEDCDQVTEEVMTAIRKHSCQAERATFMTLDGISTELPIGVRALPMRRTMTTASTAVIIPFTTQELLAPHGNWYGINSQSGNVILADRTQEMNGNGFILGTTGSGKSQSGKMEITNVFLSRPDDDIIIIDPEHEYPPLIKAYGGTTIQIHAGSTDTVNPMDISLESGMADGDAIHEKADFILQMISALVGGKEGLTAAQKSLIDRCAVKLYRTHAAAAHDGVPMVQPTLLDLQKSLQDSESAEGHELAGALDLYTTGSLNLFAHETNVQVDNRLVSWDISSLGNELKTFGMMVVLDQIWRRTAYNRQRGRRTWLYIDEFHLLFSNRFSSEYFRSLYKRARKWGLIPTGITQNIDEL
ncbi:VirB4-like conjugal transfer ATPase, CD1110 family, partial [Bifidobacterium tibiigranuli]